MPTSSPTASTAGGSTGYGDTVRDSQIPVFSGALGDYKEYRRRIRLYMSKMKLLKREAEGALNMLGSLNGTAWKLLENFDLAEAEKPDAIEKILKILDKAFEYDNRVQLPQDFDRYFTMLQRKPGQTLLQYVTDYDECYRRLEDHKISLPGPVQGWHLLRKAGLSREQKQLIMTQAPTLERARVQEAMFLILGQDHKHVAGHPNRFQRGGRGQPAYFGEDDATYDHVESYEMDEPYWQETEYDETVLYEYDQSEYADWEADDFDGDAAYYYNGDEEAAGDPAAEAEVFDEAYAAYLDARKRFNDIKLARGYLPIVALDGSG